MAIYYVRTDGSDTNAGTGPAINQAWQTLGKALGATGIASGDTLYIAPGVYRQSVTVAITNPTATTTIYGDSTASQFSGIAPGIVRVTNYNVSDNSTSTSGSGIINTRDYFTWRDITFVCPVSSSGSNTTFYRCIFESSTLSMGLTATANSNITIDSCIFFGRVSIAVSISFPRAASNYNPNMVIKNCYINIDDVSANPGIRFGVSGSGAGIANDVLITNCTIFHPSRGVDTYFASGFTGRMALIQNCLINSNTAAQCDVVGQIGLQNNRYSGVTTNVTLISGNTSLSYMGIDTGQSRLSGIPNQMITNMIGSPNIGYGVTSNAPTVDLYNNAWSTGTPDAGSGAYVSNATTSFYFPTERNASTITIAPGSTSQSIELYLGVTGLAFNTSGLSAYYIRNRSAPVPITLVTQTATGTWTSGGFAEISSSLTPGVYRLDVPDAAFAAGADDVTVVVRGASGTNGAVMTIKLSSGGLTSAQTASAVWGASPAGYNDATTFGGVVNQIDQTVTGIDTAVQDVPSNVWEEMRATHTTAGTFGQYVNAELVTPVTSAALVRMGPYEVKADGLGASDPLDIQKGAQHGVDIQCVDGNGNGIDITSATVTAKVYNSGGSLVDTYSCTATYAADGRATFTIDTTVTDTPGTYTATITRTTGASDTQVFGPLRIYVRDI